MGVDNTPADTPSRYINATSMSIIDYAAIAADQSEDTELTLFINNSALQIKKTDYPGTNIALYADSSTNTICPYVPAKHRYVLFRHLHNLSHPGVRASQ